MEVIGCFFSRRSLSAFPILPPRSRRRSFQSPSLVPLMMSSSPSSAQEAYKGPRPRRDLVGDWVSSNNGLVRSLPIYIGGLSLLVVLLNRAFSGIALVTDASRVWESLSSTTCCRSLVVIYGGNCFLQIGIAAESQNEIGVAMVVDVHKLLQGSLCRSAIGSGKQSYLANLSLYPGRSELPFLPSNTQSVILQPLGDRGIAIVGGDIIRGFTNLDQAWITLIAEKLDATLSEL
ncbi:hypothetical protein MUK42_04918 [Musa troglodytarum]|uniref:Protein COFACTOR ASSEMBLY OF COMPLEX C SUBUNIT B CCB4, chloroplastic n=1 Tax=Musa troglodytarum TaxID=320322 RepID=A0A9E7IMV3_9LILI|nr:hypothetical protein MUK42_04918 [Musa troglodytarum]